MPGSPEPPPRVLDATGLERIDRAVEAQLASSAALNLRASLLAGFSAMAILFLAQFSTAWLDDARWELEDLTDTVLLWSLGVAVVGLSLCVLLALVAAWPRRQWSGMQRRRIDALLRGDEAEESRLGFETLRELQDVSAAKGQVLKVANLPLAVALVALMVHGGAFVFDAEPVETRVGAPSPPAATGARPGLPPAAIQRTLALRHAPRVWLHRHERFGPMDPGAFVAASALRWLDRRDRRTLVPAGPDPRRLGAGCDAQEGGCMAFGGFLSRELTRPYSANPRRAPGLALARGFYLDPPDDVRRGDPSGPSGVPVFYELRRTGGELAVTYWLFSAYSRPFINVGSDTRRNLLNLAHEGDWENIDVVLGPAPDHRPLRVLFYGHGHPVPVPWERVERVGGTHPVVFSALDSHASYPTAAEVRGRDTKVCGAVGCSHDFRSRGRRWDTWAAGGVRDARAEPWYGFGGAWGRAGDLGGTTGPLGPSPFKLPEDREPGELASAAGA